MIKNYTFDKQDFFSYISIKLGLANSTTDAYIGKITTFENWLIANNLSLNPISIEKFLYSKKDKPNTINLYIVLFKHLENYLKDRGMPQDLIKGFKTRKIERPPVQILTPNEIMALLEQRAYTSNKIREKYRVFTKFLYLTCCRVGEAINLTCENVDLGGGWITFTHTKGKKYRKVPIQEPLISDLKPYIQGKAPTELVFQSSRGTIIHKGNYWRELQRKARQAGIATHLHAHIFRHTGASHLIQNGVPIELVSKILGHEDLSLTLGTYIHLRDDQLQKAMFKMPLYHNFVDPKEILKTFVQNVKEYNLQEDNRFSFKLEELNGKVKIEVRINKNDLYSELFSNNINTTHE